jgi:ribose-phosphate pyrophosphokinase
VREIVPGQDDSVFHWGIQLIAGTGCPRLAHDISDYLGIPLSGRDIIQFPNENLFVRLHGSARGQDVYIIQTTSPPVHRNLMELLILIDCLKRDSASRVTAVIPYLSYTRSDKKDQPRVPITARLVTDMIEVAGADRWIIIDLHAGQIQGFFKIPGDELTAFHILSNYFAAKRLENVVILTGDLGFAKRGRNFAEKLRVPLAFVEKKRWESGCETEALTIIGDVKGKNVIVVDDEVDTGSSMERAVTIAGEQGANSIYLSFAHALLSGSAVERLARLPIKEIVTTDTVPIPAEKRLPNMTILPVAPLLGEVIRRSHHGHSVGEMFDE